MKGIYAYYDTKKEEIVYIGKDSNIDKQARHREHCSPSKYNVQQINRVLQNNPNRYLYKMIYECPPHLDDIDVNGLEMQYIEALNPKFNFTKGGEGLSGHKLSLQHRKKISEANKGKKRSEEHKQRLSKIMKDHTPWNKGKKGVYSEETLKKMSNAMKGKFKGKDNYQWKEYARVIKKGKTHYGKQQYALKYGGKILKKSVDYDKLQGIADDINKTRLEV